MQDLGIFYKKVITQMSKKTRGKVTRQLPLAGKEDDTPQQLQEIVSHGFTCTLIESNNKVPWILEVYC